MKAINLINITSNAEYVAQPLVYKRGGSEHNYMLLFKLDNGYRITPYEFKLRWKYKQSGDALNLIFHILYDNELIKQLVYAENPFLKIIKPDTWKPGRYYVR